MQAWWAEEKSARVISRLQSVDVICEGKIILLVLFDCSSFSVTELIFQEVFWNINRSIFRGSICIFSWFSVFNVFVPPFLKLDASVQNHNKITSYHNSRYYRIALKYTILTIIHVLTHCVFPDGHWFQSLSHFNLSFMISLLLCLYWCARHEQKTNIALNEFDSLGCQWGKKADVWDRV